MFRRHRCCVSCCVDFFREGAASSDCIPRSHLIPGCDGQGGREDTEVEGQFVELLAFDPVAVTGPSNNADRVVPDWDRMVSAAALKSFES